MGVGWVVVRWRSRVRRLDRREIVAGSKKDAEVQNLRRSDVSVFCSKFTAF